MRTGKWGVFIMENELWKNELNALEDGNIHFKIRLAHLLATDFHKDQLEHLEYFQNRFLNMDEQINLLRHETREQSHLLEQTMQVNGQLRKTMDLQRNLEVKMIIIHENFAKLRTEFNSYLPEKLSS
jgi:hypothetical protein